MVAVIVLRIAGDTNASRRLVWAFRRLVNFSYITLHNLKFPWTASAQTCSSMLSTSVHFPVDRNLSANEMKQPGPPAFSKVFLLLLLLLPHLTHLLSFSTVVVFQNTYFLLLLPTAVPQFCSTLLLGVALPTPPLWCTICLGHTHIYLTGDPVAKKITSFHLNFNINHDRIEKGSSGNADYYMACQSQQNPIWVSHPLGASESFNDCIAFINATRMVQTNDTQLFNCEVCDRTRYVLWKHRCISKGILLVGPICRSIWISGLMI